MKTILIFLFLFLWKFNSSICNYYYDSETQFSEWYYMRCDIYEAMFLIAVLIPWFKSNIYARTLIFFSSVLIGWSVIDKHILDNHTTLNIDCYIVLPFAIASSLYYLYYQKKNK